MTSLSEAIANQKAWIQAHPGEEVPAIVFDPATFTEDSTTIVLSKAIDVTGTVVIDASPVFEVTGAHVTIDGSKSKGGRPAAFKVSTGTLDVTGLEFVNSTNKSAAILIEGGTATARPSVTVTKCLFADNVDVSIFVNAEYATVNIEDCVFTNNNTGSNTGASIVYFQKPNSTVNVTNSEFTNNGHGSFRNSAIFYFNAANSTVNIEDSSFTDNKLISYGSGTINYIGSGNVLDGEPVDPTVNAILDLAAEGFFED